MITMYRNVQLIRLKKLVIRAGKGFEIMGEGRARV